jgi:hypothetical protein
VETKTFSELSDAERAFVLKHLTQADFDLQHRLIKEAKSLVEDLEPKPLQLAENKSGIFLPIPLYQAVLGVAATLIISFLILQTEQSPISKPENKELAIADTVFVEKQIYDTVVQYEYIDRVVQIKSEKSVSTNTSSPPVRHDMTIAKPKLTPLNELDLQNKGVSLVKDETFLLVHEINGRF